MSDNIIKVNVDKIKGAVSSGAPVSITTYTLPRAVERYMEDTLSEFLTELGQTQMAEYLTYCLGELTTNAKKANTKRVYFKEKGLNINDSNDYKKGMASFKMDTLTEQRHYVSLQRKAGLYVKLMLQVREGKIKIEVRNNSELTVFEYKRIHDKHTRAEQYSSLEEALSQLLDDSEGAGLGLVMMVLMLKKIGLVEENFQTVCEGGETINRIILPLSDDKDMDVLSAEFAAAIEDLPQFPENITRLNKLLSDPDSNMADIAAQIRSDVTLTGELLKTVNSPSFGLGKACSSIEDATKMVGIRGIKNLLSSIGTVDSFKGVSGSKEELWKHAYMVASYALSIAKNFCGKEKATIDDSYICGLLHDMGKIVFETAHPDLLGSLAEKCAAKGTPTGTLEKLVSGVNHGEVGAKIAERWNFPESITSVIRYHHSPTNAPAESEKLSCVVYLADFIAHYQAGETTFDDANSDVLAIFNITDENALDTLSKRLRAAFEKDRG